MRALEVLTEVKVLKLQLPHHATEAGIRTFAAGEQQAVDLVQHGPVCEQGLDSSIASNV